MSQNISEALVSLSLKEFAAAILEKSSHQQKSLNSNTSKTSDDTFFKVGNLLCVLFFITGLALCCFVIKKKSAQTKRVVLPKVYSCPELASATKNFARNRLLGQGGTACVYKGFLRAKSLSLPVAVKRFHVHYHHAEEVFTSELMIMSLVECENLVPLIGFSNDGGELLLVYGYMQNGSLDKHLFSNETHLSWKIRRGIVLDLASALLYLHEESKPCIMHRDIKSANVLLDKKFSAKLGDFGVAKFLDTESSLQDRKLVGTMGYIAPEYYHEGRASKESDIYSFGTVVLEVACGRRKPKDKECDFSLVQWVWELYGSGRILDVADERLNMEFDLREMECLLIVGLWCAYPVDKQRPTARQVVQVLNFESPLPNLPNQMPSLRYNLTPPPGHSDPPSIMTSLKNGC